MNKTSLKRQYDLDWIRVLATIGVFFYHCSMFFNPFPWHVKNNVLDSNSILVFSLFVGAWMMPIFFAVSGIGVAYALRKRKNTEFLKERMIRLFVPLVFGVFILTPPQVYMERVSHHQFQGSFLAFIPHYFDGVYLDIGGTGNFAFFGLHLWYLLVLIVFSLFTLPIFRRVTVRSKFGNLHLFLLPCILILSGIIKTQSLGGWDIVFYLLIFIYGYYFFYSEAFQITIKSTIKAHLIMAILTSIVFIVWALHGMPQQGTVQDYLFFALRVFNCWSWVLCIFFLANKYLSMKNRFLKYGSEASMPFYVLHQPIIVVLGFFIRDVSWSIPVKIMFLAFVSFIIIMVCYHFIIRRVNLLRILFGMKKIDISKMQTANKGESYN
ncbi:acyltransferase family protein [Bacillus sp. FJAT-49736]|uniref:acyltransferase family protein n=1 Tax=Bacillus sp. FJAT-49736 TaxID=2833582 RepID=UPI001BC9E416|nr:acyltransferase family protein [Bacillus sp. FJAT-49736]MBS4172194.1 acyltransferase family protein [Bacillus sp. FJAT-49736]